MGCDLPFFFPMCLLAQLFAKRLDRLYQLAQRLPFQEKARDPGRDKKMIACYVNWESLDAKQDGK
jgi:hypothetical protein